MKAFLVNAVNSWFTSIAGSVVGLPVVWVGLQPLFDSDAATGPDWGMVIKGVGILIVGMMSRDWTNNVIPAKK